MKHSSCVNNDIYSKIFKLKQIDVEILEKEKDFVWL